MIGGALYITFRLMRDFNTLRNRIQAIATAISGIKYLWDNRGFINTAK